MEFKKEYKRVRAYCIKNAYYTTKKKNKRRYGKNDIYGIYKYDFKYKTPRKENCKGEIV